MLNIEAQADGSDVGVSDLTPDEVESQPSPDRYEIDDQHHHHYLAGPRL